MLLVNQPTSAFSQFNSGISKNNNTNTVDDNICDASTISAALLAELANRQHQQHLQRHPKFSLHSALGNFEALFLFYLEMDEIVKVLQTNIVICKINLEV